MHRVVSFIVFGCLALTAFVLVTNAYIRLSTQTYLYDDARDVPVVQAVLIPGAPLLLDGTPAPIFIDRADAALALYNTGKAPKILVSGDNSTLAHNEVNPMRLYLLEKGIPDADIFLDHAGFDTYSSMYRAKYIFGVSSLIVASQSFHLPRAVFIARALGMDAYGMDADIGHILLRNYVREIFSNEKALGNIIFQTKPRYLGAVIPITGDGTEYP